MIPRTRRTFLATTALAASSALTPRLGHALTAAPSSSLSAEDLERAAASPLLRTEGFDSPILLESIELLRNNRDFLVRVRSRDGAESVTAANSALLAVHYPVFLKNVAPFFLDQDARNLESLLEDLYRHPNSYMNQGLAFWSCVATVEMAILDLLGQISGKSIGDLFGGVKRHDIPVYCVSDNRGNTPGEEIAFLEKLVAETGAAALKFRVGGGTSNNAELVKGRTEALIPLVRKTFGGDMTIYADSNGSYDASNAIRIGRLMEEQGFSFFEEPCRFDYIWETKEVADTLELAIAGGEQEISLRRFRWSILNRALDVFQPDLHNFGGYIRCTKVARMANLAGRPCNTHMSGTGLGYIKALHFASYIDDPGPFQHFRGTSHLPLHCPTSDLQPSEGIVRVPTGPGFGVTVDPAFVAEASPVTTI